MCVANNALVVILYACCVRRMKWCKKNIEFVNFYRANFDNLEISTHFFNLNRIDTYYIVSIVAKNRFFFPNAQTHFIIHFHFIKRIIECVEFMFARKCSDGKCLL